MEIMTRGVGNAAGRVNDDRRRGGRLYVNLDDRKCEQLLDSLDPGGDPHSTLNLSGNRGHHD